jgi:hypothetical protein
MAVIYGAQHRVSKLLYSEQPVRVPEQYSTVLTKTALSYQLGTHN